ncbi:tRNA 5-methylaminomethyl-2-thiouridine synthase [Bradyrhizobium rifense]|uniref:tRNA 5-methylaminomethyl-2-thiouridine synthase n=1 Tax=Bradyrhizobium rifense TaxID=515499 RepID=A0A5D3KN97_9BRAD|nr:tRNA 5-methylaminomethyl-2-thiouridine synthase [Bradyrhizobium rifense]
MAGHAAVLFHFEGQQPHTDTTGEALHDDEAAWREAIRLSRDVEHALRPSDSWTLSVFDGTEPGFVLAMVTRRFR